MVKMEMPDIRLGMIMQSHDGEAPIAAATAAGADFVRIKVFAGTMYKAEGIRTGVGGDGSAVPRDAELSGEDTRRRA